MISCVRAASVSVAVVLAVSTVPTKAQEVPAENPAWTGAPTLTTVAIGSTPPDDRNQYAIGDTIIVTVTFDQNVQVDVSNGKPTLGVTVGRAARRAAYVGNRSGRVIEFEYTVREGDSDADGIDVPADGLRLNGATIRGARDHDAQLRYVALAGGIGHAVDGLSPSPVGVRSTGTEVRVTWDGPLDPQSIPPPHAFSVWMDGRIEQPSVSAVALLGRTTRLALDATVPPDGAVTVEYTAPDGSAPFRDAVGNATQAFAVTSASDEAEDVQATPVETDSRRRETSGRRLPAETVRQIEDTLAAKNSRTSAQRKVGSVLLEAVRRAHDRRDPIADDASDTGFLSTPIEVDIRADVTPELLSRIGELGGTVVNSFPRYRAVRARLPLSAVETLAAEDAVATIRPADEAQTQRPVPRPAIRGADASNAAKVNTTEGDVAHAADAARASHVVDGTGIGIGVLSDGVDSLAERQATGDVPAGVTVLSGQAGRGDEGTAMLEIVHDLAPGADLYFATALGSQARFATNIEALCDAGADVIVDDIFYFEEAVFQDDDVAQAISAVVADGCFYFSAAGNSGHLNDESGSGTWEGDFVAGEEWSSSGTAHAFTGGVSGNEITKDTSTWFYLKWADPLGGSSNDYDLFLLDPDDNVAASSTDTQDGTQDPVERIASMRCARSLLFFCLEWENIDHTGYRLVVVKSPTAEERYFQLHTNRGRLAIGTAGATWGHAASKDAFGIAAVDARQADGTVRAFDGTESVEWFSSDGPRRMFFEPDGTPVTPGNFGAAGGRLLQKPDLTAADGVSTATPGFEDFHGTSAAAPHAAAIATLMLEAVGGPNNLTVAELRTAMSGASLDIEASGWDRDAGAGILMAPAAVAAVAVPPANRNGAPAATALLANRVVAPEESLVLDLARAFTDPDGDALSYAVSSGDNSLVTTVLSGSRLTLTMRRLGRVEVTVSATDPSGLGAVRSFVVSTGETDYDVDDDGLIEVANLAQLDAMRHDLDGDGAADGEWRPHYRAFAGGVPGMGCPAACTGYELAANLDFDANGNGEPDAGDPHWNDGGGWLPIGDDRDPFRATFEGNGRRIANLFIRRPGRDDIGLFGVLGVLKGLAPVRHLGLTGVDVTGRDGVGGLAGRTARGGRARGIYASGSVSGQDQVGGLVGESAGIVAGSYAAVNVAGERDVGGLVGNVTLFGGILASYATGRVSGDDDVGGIAGYLRNDLSNSYSTGPASGPDDAGGLVGSEFGAEIAASYWDSTTTALASGIGQGRTTTELQTPTDYDGLYRAWDVDIDEDDVDDDPWHFGTATQYPALRLDMNGDGHRTWQEFGHQLREGPTLTASAEDTAVRLTWTAPDLTHWTPAPVVAYVVYRDSGDGAVAVAEQGGLTYVDEAVAAGTGYTYQVAATVGGGEATRSAPVMATPGATNAAPEPVGKLADQTLREGDPAVTVDVSGAFRDPDGDSLTYAASSSATDVATADASGAEVRIEAVSAGSAVVTVTATDGGGSNATASQSFTVTVRSANEVDYDEDDDGLIEVATLAQLDAVRHDLDGDGVADASSQEDYAAAYANAAPGMGCAIGGCIGYELDADLDFDTNGNGEPDAGDAHWNGGAGWMPIGDNSVRGRFSATFDGNGRTLANLFVRGGDYVGLFGAVGSSGVVRRVALQGVDVSGQGHVGALAGRFRQESSLASSFATGRVSGEDHVGGLVGRNDGTVAGCFATVLVSGGNRVGGLAARNGPGATIKASYATGWVSGDNQVGGLVGDNDGAVAASYATSRVVGERYAGGLAGEGSGRVDASYWDTRTSGRATGDHGSGRSTGDLQEPVAYTGIFATWNADLDGDGAGDDPWAFGSSSQYPALVADMDSDGDASWQEFGFQLRAGPELTAATEPAGIALAWTSVDTSPWNPAPTVAFAVYRLIGDGVTRIASAVRERRYVDAQADDADSPAYQVAAIVDGGEATRSAEAQPPAPVDEQAPEVQSIVSATQHPTRDPFNLTITFSEPVTGLTSQGIDVAQGTASGFSGADATYTVTVTPDDGIEGDVTVTVLAGQARDAADNGNPAASESFAVDTRPPALVSDDPTVDAATLTLSWTEPLLDRTPPAAAFTLAGGAVANRVATVVSVSGSALSLTLDPPVSHGESALAISYARPASNPVRDAVGNAAAAFANRRVANETADVDAPTVASITSDANHPTKDAFAVTIAFSEPVTGLNAGEIDVAGGTASGFSGSGANYRIRIEPDADLDGDVTVAIPAGAAEDAAHNGSVAASETFAVDTLVPDLAQATVDAAALTLEWNEAMDPDSVPAPDAFAVAGGDTTRRVTGVTVAGSTVRLSLDPAIEHRETDIVLDYAPPVSTPLADALGNPAAAFDGQAVANTTRDTTPPTVTSIQSSASHPVRDAFRATITFSEPVAGLLGSEISVAGGTGSGFSGSGETYGIDLEPDPDLDGDVTVHIPPAVATDAAGNGNAARSTSFAVDTQAPELAVDEGVVIEATALTLTWNELLDGDSTPARDAFTVSGGATARTVTSVVMSGRAINLTVDPAAASGEDAIEVGYVPPAENPVLDALGNAAEGFSGRTATNRTPDGDAPTVASMTSTATHPTKDSFTVTIVFSESVSGLTGTEIEIDGGAGSDFSGSGTTYTVDIEPDADLEGDVTVTVPAGAAEDDANNGNVARGEAFAVDTKAPSLDPAAPAVADGASLTLTWHESLARNPVPAAAFSVTGEVARTVTAVTVQGGTTDLTVSPAVSHGERGIAVAYDPPAVNPLEDPAGNRAAAVAGQPVENRTPDRTAPRLASMVSDATHPTNEPFAVTIRFSEAVTTLTEDGIAVVNGVGSNLTGSGEQYELDVEPETGIDDNVEVKVLAEAVRDSAGNANEAGSAAFAVDTKPPVLATDGARIDGTALTLTWSEALAGGSPVPVTAFTVAGTLPRSVTAVALSGDTVHLTVDPAAVAGEAGIAVSYAAPTTNPLVDALGNAAADFAGQAVRNDTSVEYDYDDDDDGLIEVRTLVQLDAVRHDLDGDGVPDPAAAEQYAAAFPRAPSGMGCGGECSGYELRADLDFDTNRSGGPDPGDLYWDDGRGWAPIGTLSWFEATFEGNGHTLHGLFIDRDAAAGLFGNTAAASVIRRVGLVGVVVAGKRTGALASQTSGTVEACHATGRVIGSGATGGLVGWIDRGTVLASYATTRVSGVGSWVGGLAGFNAGMVVGSYASGAVDGRRNLVGGLVGDNAGTIRAAYATGSVVGEGGVGGLAGRNVGTIAASLATGRVRDSGGGGGLVGWGSGDVEGYWDTTTSGRTEDGAGTGHATAELQGPTGYTGLFGTWNVDLDADGAVDDPWRFGTSAQYPVLAADMDGDGTSTWEEFGYQIREGPGLSVEAASTEIVLTWSAADTSHWSPAPALAYAVTRDDNAVAEDLTTTRYVDPSPGSSATYQVVAVVSGGEATRSARLSTVPSGNRPPVAVGTLPDRTFGLGDSPLRLDVSGAFRDPDGDALTYQAVSSASAVLDVAVSGSTITLTPNDAGSATVTVTATDDGGSGGSATQSFEATVRATATVDYDADDDDLIEVSTLVQLDAIRHDPDGDGVSTLAGQDEYDAAFPSSGPGMGCAGMCAGYELTTDLDFDTDGDGQAGGGDAFWNDGAGWAPIRDFTAVFDGGGRQIRNLRVDRPGDGALFAQIGGSGSIRRLGLTDVDIAGNRVAGLAARNDGTVARSYVTGRIAGKGNSGGLVGWNGPSGQIRASYATARVDSDASLAGGLAGRNDGAVRGSYATGRVTAKSNVGGLVGQNRGLAVAVYAAGGVFGDTGVGGLAGSNAGDIRSGYATGRVAGRSNVGGLVGWETGGNVAAGYWDTVTSGHSAGAQGDPATTASLQAPTGYTGIFEDWDVDADGDGASDDPWRFGTDVQYPALAADLDGDGVRTWQEFGYQLREGPTLTLEVGDVEVTLTWTSVDGSHWTGAATVSYAVTRDGEIVAEGLTDRRHVDANTVGAYQVLATILGGEASRSAWQSTSSTGNQGPVAVGMLPDRTLGAADGPVVFDVAAAFEDPDGDPLTFAASSSEETVAGIAVSGTKATITPLAEGTATIKVTATDEGGSNTMAS